MTSENTVPQSAGSSQTRGTQRPSIPARKLAAAAGLAVLLALSPRAAATELLVNRSFDQGGDHWQVAPQANSNIVFGTIGEAALHVGGGYLGTVIWQDLDLSNVGGATGTASMDLNQMSAPPGNSIAVYLEYTVETGDTNRLLLFNPANTAVLFRPDSSHLTTNFTLPANARHLLRLTAGTTYYGDFFAQEFSLDVVTAGGTPELGLSIVVPAEGETNTAPFLLRAGVTNLTATVSSLVFCANGVTLGEGRLDPHGEWAFADGSHLSVMGGVGYEMVDYSEPYPGGMFFMMDGNFTSLTNFAGGFQYFLPGGGMGGGAVSILYSLDANDRLTAAITGDAPLGVRTLSNGTNQSDTINYGFFWANAPAGKYAITARAVYGSGLSVTSAPVNITVIGSVLVVSPVLKLIPVASGNFAFQWDATLGNTYQVQTTTNLGSTNWINLGSSFVATNSPVAVTNTIGTDATRFFRVQAIGN